MVKSSFSKTSPGTPAASKKPLSGRSSYKASDKRPVSSSSQRSTFSPSAPAASNKRPLNANLFRKSTAKSVGQASDAGQNPTNRIWIFVAIVAVIILLIVLAVLLRGGF